MIPIKKNKMRIKIFFFLFVLGVTRGQTPCEAN